MTAARQTDAYLPGRNPLTFLPGNYLGESVIKALLEQYGQVGVCLDENKRVVQAFGDLSPYLLSKGFNFNFNLLELLPESLLVAFGTAFNGVVRYGEPMAIRGIPNEVDPSSSIHLLLKPFIVAKTGQKLLLLLLSPDTEQPMGDAQAQQFDLDRQQREYITFLEEQLAESKENLLSAAEELEAYRENMQSFNEELLSAGEEMQSSNEELQSINEELKTINMEYGLKIKELQELNDDLNNYFRSNVSGQLFVDKDILLRKFSPAAVQHINVQESDIGRPLHHLTTNIRFDTLLTDIEKVISSGELITKEIQATTGRWFQVRVMPYLRQADKRTDGAMVTFYDISDLINARRKMEEQAAEVLSLMESIPQITCSSFPDGRVNYFNQNWYEYSGMSLEQTSDWGWQTVIHSDDLGKVKLLWQLCLASGEPFETQFRLRRKDGIYRWHLTRAVPIQDSSGVILKWVSTMTDIDDQRALLEELTQTKKQLLFTNEQLSRINEDLDTFVYTASHDLRSPVNSLQGLVGILSSILKDKLEEKDSKLLEKVDLSVAKLRGIITDLTQIAKSQKDIDLEKEWVSVQEMLEDVLSDLSGQIEQSAAQIHTQIDVPHLLYARKNLRSILYNLISNAIKYRSPEREPQVKLTFQMSKSIPVLIVADNGLGLNPDQVSKLFAAFKRFHTHVEGTGIGLYMIKRIVENNGGWIKVESKMGEGTSFEVYLGQATVVGSGKS